MTKNNQGYALLVSMIALVLLTTITGLMALSTGGDMRRSNTSRTELQSYYVAEVGLEKALLWFRNDYGLLGNALVNTAPATPPTVTDPAGNTYTVSVSLTNGSPVVLNTTGIGSATTHKAVLENPDHISKTVLARGLRYHLEDRVIVHENKTVVFD